MVRWRRPGMDQARRKKIWILTMTFADLYESAMSKFYTCCLAVGKSSNDHQPFLDYYMDEVDKLTNDGVNVFCTANGVYKRVKIDLLT